MRIFIFLVLSFLPAIAVAQGCSDAGFCTMGAMRPDQNYSKKVNIKLRSVEYNFYRGKTTTTPVVYAHTIEFNATINDVSALQVKVPYMHVSGNLGNNQGLGDVSVSFTRNFNKWKDWEVNGTIGLKIPTNNSNRNFSSENTSEVAVPLPMYYQVSLGSYDVIAGASILKSDWLFATGVQVALTQNENSFAIGDWSAYPSQGYLRNYDEGRDLKRGTDIMLRVERNFRFVNYNFSIGLLPIYRITRDEVFIPDLDRRVKLPGTTGLALSGLVSFGYSLDVQNKLKLIYGYKFTDRDVNPDGLTRDNVLSFSYIYQF